MSHLTPAELLSRLEPDELITIIVDPDSPDKKEYRIQRTHLIDASEWFEKALNRTWIEGKERVLRFLGTDPQVIELFLYYLFTGVLHFEDDSPATQMLAVKLWVFADEHLLPKLQNLAMRRLYNAFEQEWSNPDLDIIREGFETTSTESTLHAWLTIQLLQGLEDRMNYKTLVAKDPSQQRTPAPGYSVDSLEVLDGCPGLVAHLASQVVLRTKRTKRRLSLLTINRYLVPENIVRGPSETMQQPAGTPQSGDHVGMAWGDTGR